MKSTLKNSISEILGESENSIEKALKTNFKTTKFLIFWFRLKRVILLSITEKMLLVIFLNQANARDPLSLVKRTCTQAALKRGFIYKSLGPIHTRCV